MLFRVVSCIMALLLLAMPVYAQVDEVQQATSDALQDAQDDVSMFAWGAGGFVCSGCAVLFAYFSTPEIPVHRMIGKSPSYVETYTLVYQQHAKKRRIQASVIGCGIASAISTVSYYLFVLPQLNTL